MYDVFCTSYIRWWIYGEYPIKLDTCTHLLLLCILRRTNYCTSYSDMLYGVHWFVVRHILYTIQCTVNVPLPVTHVCGVRHKTIVIYLFTVRRTKYAVRRTVYGIQCYDVRHILYVVHYTTYSVRWMSSTSSHTRHETVVYKRYDNTTDIYCPKLASTANNLSWIKIHTLRYLFISGMNLFQE